MENKNDIRKSKERIKNRIDKAGTILYADDECTFLLGFGPEVLSLWTMITSKLKDLAGEKLMKDAFKIAMDATENNKSCDELEKELKQAKKDLLNKLKEMLERE